MILIDDPAAIGLPIRRAYQPPHGLEPTDMHLGPVLCHHRVLCEVEIDTVAALMMGSEMGHGSIDITHIDRHRRQADDAACRVGRHVFANDGIVASRTELTRVGDAWSSTFN